MNPDTVSELLQKGFRVTLGATTALLEAVQDPQGQSAKYSQIGTDWNRLAEDLEAKGEVTEQEARRFVDNVFAQMPNPFAPAATTGGSTRTVNTTATPVVDIGIQTDLQELTQEIAALRAELDQMRSRDV